MRINRLLLSLIVSVFFQSPAFCQTLDSRLSQLTDFIPQSDSVPDQLVEIAQKYGIVMGIEWLEDGRPQPALSFHHGSVRKLIQAIVQRSRTHKATFDSSIVHVFSTSARSNPMNFLNLRIPEFRVQEESLFGADAWLKTSINLLLYPPEAGQGYGGGYGGGEPQVYWKRNITFSGRNLTIREILTGIAVTSGNALYYVQLHPDEFKEQQPYWIGVPRNEFGHSPLNARWRFIPVNQ
jgi:hypothetical protein